MAPLVGQRLQSILSSIDPTYTLDADAEEQLLRLADDFVDNVVRRGIRLARHRGSDRLDVADLSLVLRKGWGITVPGLGGPTSSSGGNGVSSLSAARTLSSGAAKGAGASGGGTSTKGGNSSGTKRKSDATSDGNKAAKRPATGGASGGNTKAEVVAA